MRALQGLVLCACAAYLAVGCVSVAGSGGPPKGLDSGDVMYATQATIGACPGQAAESALLASISSAIIAKGVNRIGAAIKAAGAEETRQVMARRNVELSARDPVGPCLIIARGWFYRDRSIHGGDPPYQVREEAKFAHESKRSDIRRTGLMLAATPDFYFEGGLSSSTDKTASTVVPLYAFLDRPIASSFLRRSKERRVLVAFAITPFDKPVDVSKAGSTIVVGRIGPGRGLTFPNDNDQRIAIECTFPSDCQPGSDDFAQRIRSAYESEWFALALSEEPRPMSLQVLVSETRDESAFLKFVSDVFGEVDKDVAAELQKSLIPSVRDAADEAETSADEAAAGAFDTAFADAAVKLAACEQAGNDIAKAAAAKVAMRSLNKAARRIDKVEPLGPGDIDGIRLDGAAAPACKAAREKLSAYAR